MFGKRWDQAGVTLVQGVVNEMLMTQKQIRMQLVMGIQLQRSEEMLH